MERRPGPGFDHRRLDRPGSGRVEMHIGELAELGVAPPARTPIFYRVAASLLTTAPAVDVIGTDSTGEVECVLLNHAGEWWVGVGSDHTDRKAETIGVTLSKQLCPKPLAPSLWSFDDVEPHWDELILRSYAVSGAERVRSIRKAESRRCVTLAIWSDSTVKLTTRRLVPAQPCSAAPYRCKMEFVGPIGSLSSSKTRFLDVKLLIAMPAGPYRLKAKETDIWGKVSRTLNSSRLT